MLLLTGCGLWGQSIEVTGRGRHVAAEDGYPLAMLELASTSFAELGNPDPLRVTSRGAGS